MGPEDAAAKGKSSCCRVSPPLKKGHGIADTAVPEKGVLLSGGNHGISS